MTESPAEIGRRLAIASGWSEMNPAAVAGDPEFRRTCKHPLNKEAGRPYRSVALSKASGLVLAEMRAARPKPRESGPLVRLSVPHFMPVDLHVRYTSDLIYDSWKTPKGLHFQRSRRIAAMAAFDDFDQPRSRAVSAVRERLEERGQLEAWLRALTKATEALRRNPQVFGATLSDVDLFSVNFRQDSCADLPLDAAVLWFLRDHRCVDYLARLGWSPTRARDAGISEFHARRSDTCGRWNLIEERLKAAAAVADTGCRDGSQTA
ncbi:hypothetical protein [Nocardioides sp. WS12]|uniref:hypothetical protein n=1 Tax=Nocardioides sp. WS12 TaxID=2486272 RepID=UPI001F47205E|nr:hypothetical protein [Nocardioides sp. WS12]